MHRSCPLCASTDFDAWRFGLLRCGSCTLVVARDVWKAGSNADLNEIFFERQSDAGPTGWQQMFERWNNRRTIERLQRSDRSTRGDLLEVGVGSGSFLAYARTHGYTPSGCDISSAICQRVAALGVDMYCGTLESQPPGELFDVVVMNHVLEHVSDPLALLEAARRRLRPGGFLHLAVPNLEAWEARCSGWNNYEPYHLLYFTPQTLKRIARKAGFEVERLDTHESFSGWFLALVRTIRGQSLVNRPVATTMTATSASPSFECGYRIAMLTAGAVTYPLRRLQEALGSGDELILLGTAWR